VPSVSAARTGAASLTRSRCATTQRQQVLAGVSSSAVHLAVIALPVAPLTASAEKALLLADAAKSESDMPEAGKDGRVTYTSGLGLPAVVTSPMHI